jgi:uncharacterized protein (TIGR02301 family)
LRLPQSGRISVACRGGLPDLKKLLTLAAVALCLAAPVHAQKQQKQQQPEPAPAVTPSAPYDADLQRLAEILGALQYLRTVCKAYDGEKWRDQMQALLDAEAPDGERRRKIVANFNRGYRGFQQTYRTCTPAADLVIRRYLDEGAKIAREITARYAN